MAKHHKKVTGPCTYCNVDRGPDYRLTEDHVIPGCLFVRGRAPADAPIVYACQPCNNTKKNLDDSFLRDMLVMDTSVFGHPIASEIFEGQVMRAARQELFDGPLLRAAGSKGYVQSPIAHMVMKNQGHKRSAVSPGGIYLGEVFGISLPDDRVLRIFSTVARGLYWAYNEKEFPAGTQFRVKRERDIGTATENARTILTIGGAFRQIGDGSVFQCVYGLVPERPDMTIWFLAFYRQIVFAVGTDNPGLPIVETSALLSSK